jgi:hypothetical protein
MTFLKIQGCLTLNSIEVVVYVFKIKITTLAHV